MRSEDLTPFNLSALVIAAVFIVIGLPAWWKTTTVYRAPLPVELIEKLGDIEIVYTVTIEMVGQPASPEVAKQLETLIQSDLTKLSSAQPKVSYKLSFSNLSDRISGKSSLAELDEELNQLEPGYFRIYELPGDGLRASGKDIWIGCHRTIFTTNVTALLPRIAKLITNLLVGEPLLQRSYEAFFANNENQKANVKSMTAVRSKPGYQLSFSLLNSDPGDFLVQWDIKQTVRNTLMPFLERLDNISTFSIDSQILRYVDLGLTPKYDPENKTHFLSFKDLPHTINAVESRLGTFVSSNPTLEFIVYVPPSSQSPLFIRDKSGQNVAHNSFLSPRWGGIVIHNPKATGSKMVSVPTSLIMPVFISQLKRLLGFEKTVKLSDSTFLRLHPSGITDWELDGLMLRRCVENVATASAALISLTSLLEKVKNMVIADHLQNLTAKAVESIDECVAKLRAGHLLEAFLLSKVAVESAETAFYDPSMLELLYFPEDQKFAIYVPLFVPVGIPVLFSSLIALRRWRKKREETTS